MQYFT